MNTMGPGEPAGTGSPSPFFRSDRVLHFGASGAWREPPQNAPADATMPCSADYYGYVSWLLTGESRNYKADKGIFDILVPNKPFSLTSGGLGAWELGARYSEIDLNDDGVSGGRERDITAGLNWYPNAYIRFMANYIHVLEIDGGPHDEEDLDIFQVRAQVAY